MKNLFKINWNEIVFDLLLFIYAEFFLYTIVSDGRWFFQILSINMLFVIGVIIDFFMIWHLGVIFSRYKKYTNNIITLSIIILTSAWIVLSLHFGVAFNISDIFGDTDIINLAIFGYLLVMVGIGGGIIFAATEVKKSGGNPALADRANALKKLVPTGMVAMNAFLTYHILDFIDMKIIFLGIIIWAFLTFIEFFIFSITEKILRKRESEYSEQKESAFQRFLFPVIVITLLCLWDEIYIWGKINSAAKAGESISSAGMILYLVFTGIIPMRLLMAFQPPIKIINLIIGAGSIGYFIFSVIRLVDGL